MLARNNGIPYNVNTIYAVPCSSNLFKINSPPDVAEMERRKVPHKKHTEYYRCLDKAQNQNDFSGLIYYFEKEQKFYQENVFPLLFDYDSPEIPE